MAVVTFARAKQNWLRSRESHYRLAATFSLARLCMRKNGKTFRADYEKYFLNRF